MGRPKEFDRDRVVERALEVFWSRGYQATSVDDLTTAMRLGRGSLYNEFRDKHSLFLAALDRYRADRLAGLTEILESAPSARAGIAGALRGTIQAMFADTSRRGCLMVNSVAELASSDAAVRRRARDSFGGTARVIRAALERGQRTGEFGPNIDTEATSHFLATALYSIRWLSKMSERAVADDVLEVTLKALE